MNFSACIGMLGCAVAAAAMSVDLRVVADSPAEIGTTFFLSARAADSTGVVWYRYRVRNPGEAAFRTVRDYSATAEFEFAPTQTEGTYEIEVSALDRETGEIASQTQQVEVIPRTDGVNPIISGTRHPLVFLFSAPPCPAGSSTHVRFEAPDGFVQATPATLCDGIQNLNVYLAGLRPSTQYLARQFVWTAEGETTAGPVLTLTSGELPLSPFPTRPILKPSGVDQAILLQGRVNDHTIATDLDGNVVWYYPQPVRYLTRPEPGGRIVTIFDDASGGDTDQILRVIDLSGAVIVETNAGAINDQLERLGRRRITSFHHEARILPDGRIMVLAANEQLMTDVQGPGEVDVIGEMILVLNHDLEVEWVWDAFDHLDPRRVALLRQTCGSGTGGCPVLRLAARGNDWLHANSLQLTPDGHILMSIRHQDWVIKIDFANGLGSGNVIWRLGKDGDFTFLSDDPWPWFSHQHDANILPDSPTRMLVFDNGNVRFSQNSSAQSRGQVLRIDEENRTVTFDLNVNLGAYPLALGSAQLLSNGNYHFNLGWMPNARGQALEYDASGQLVTQVESETQLYRTFRMRNLYTPF